jgi:protein-disulfide isomerase
LAQYARKITKMQVVKGNKLKRLSLFLALALLTLVIVVVVSSGGSGSKGQRQTFVREPDPVRRTYALLTGIPQRGSVLGDPKAPVTLQFFGDLQCVQSRQAMLGTLPFLIRRFVRAGHLQIHFRSAETDTKEAGGWPEFLEQQAAAMAAGGEGKLWNFVSVFYREQGPEFTGYVDEAFLTQIAAHAGLNIGRWQSARLPPEVWVRQLKADEALAKAKGLESTPSFLIGPTGGAGQPLRHFSLEEPKVFEEAIEGLL